MEQQKQSARAELLAAALLRVPALKKEAEAAGVLAAPAFAESVYGVRFVYYII